MRFLTATLTRLASPGGEEGHFDQGNLPGGRGHFGRFYLAEPGDPRARRTVSRREGRRHLPRRHGHDVQEVAVRVFEVESAHPEFHPAPTSGYHSEQGGPAHRATGPTSLGEAMADPTDPTRREYQMPFGARLQDDGSTRFRLWAQPPEPSNCGLTISLEDIR